MKINFYYEKVPCDFDGFANNNASIIGYVPIIARVSWTSRKWRGVITMATECSSQGTTGIVYRQNADLWLLEVANLIWPIVLEVDIYATKMQMHQLFVNWNVSRLQPIYGVHSSVNYDITDGIA